MKARYQKADVRGVGANFAFIPMAQSQRQKIASNVLEMLVIIPMINDELLKLQGSRKSLIENPSNIADDIARIDKELDRDHHMLTQ